MVASIEVSFEDNGVHGDRFPRNAVEVKVGRQFECGQFTLFGDSEQSTLLFKRESIFNFVVIEIVTAVDTVTEFAEFLLVNNQERLFQSNKEFHFLTSGIFMQGIGHTRIEFYHTTSVGGKGIDRIICNGLYDAITLYHFPFCFMHTTSRSKIVIHRSHIFGITSCFIKIYRGCCRYGSSLILQTFDTRIHTRCINPVISPQQISHTIAQHCPRRHRYILGVSRIDIGVRTHLLIIIEICSGV